MQRLCRLCGQPRVPSSMFCETHRDRAASFAMSFGKDKDHRSQPAEQKKALGGTEDAITMEAGRKEVSPTKRYDVEQLLQQLCQQMRETIRFDIEQNRYRWPQISLYYIRQCLQGRVYYSMTPMPINVDSKPMPIDIDGRGVNSAIVDHFIEQFFEREALLRLRKIKTINLLIEQHLCRIQITEQDLDDLHKPLAVYVWKNEKFELL